jgi:hypothetical protein
MQVDRTTGIMSISYSQSHRSALDRPQSQSEPALANAGASLLSESPFSLALEARALVSDGRPNYRVLGNGWTPQDSGACRVKT